MDIVIRGPSGATVHLEAAPELGSEAWSQEVSIPLTTEGVGTISVEIQGDARRFYRATRND